MLSLDLKVHYVMYLHAEIHRQECHGSSTVLYVMHDAWMDVHRMTLFEPGWIGIVYGCSLSDNQRQPGTVARLQQSGMVGIFGCKNNELHY